MLPVPEAARALVVEAKLLAKDVSDGSEGDEVRAATSLLALALGMIVGQQCSSEAMCSLVSKVCTETVVDTAGIAFAEARSKK